MNDTQERLLNLLSQHDVRELSLRQMAKMIGVEHAQTVKYHLAKLIEADKIRTVGGAMKVVSPGMNGGLLSIPILGSANCGTATHFAEERVEGFLRISPRLLPTKRELFIVRATGNSMNKADIRGKNIEDGDFVVIQSSTKEPSNGDYVLSVIDGCANIKRFYRKPEEEAVLLLSESTEGELHPPIIIHQDDDYQINGRVVQVIKTSVAEN